MPGQPAPDHNYLNYSYDVASGTRLMPKAYRLRRDCYGGLYMQGLFSHQVVGNRYMDVWMDLETVESDETSEPVKET